MMHCRTMCCRPVSQAVRAMVMVFVACGWLALLADESNTSSTALTGAFRGRAELAEHGVTPFATLTMEGWGNVSGGLKEHGWWNSLLEFGVELDTEKLGWWSGGQFLVQAHWVENAGNGDSFEDHTGACHPVSGVMAGEQVRIFNLYYRHGWRDDTFVLKLGQLAADDDFMGSDYAGMFLNSAFGAMSSQVGTPLGTSCGNSPAFPIYAVAAPGVYAHWRPAVPFYTQLGLYYGRPGHDEPDNHGFGWVDESPPELGLFWESGYNYRLSGRPAAARFGLTYHTGPMDDFSGDNGEEKRQTVPNFYFIHDLGLVTDKEGNVELGCFVRVGTTLEQDRSMVAYYADAGLTLFEPLPGREMDVLGVGVSYTRFGDDFRSSASGEGVAASETALEFLYRAQITRWLALTRVSDCA
jgi:porin